MDYVVKRQPMVSGQGEAEDRCYRMYIGKSRRAWFVADQPNAADNILVTDSDNWERTGAGFGGAHLNLRLIIGGELGGLMPDSFVLKGGWHTNADALFSDTGVDVRDKYLTFVVVAESRQGDLRQTTLHNVLYIDEEPTLGRFDRGDVLAIKLATELGRPVVRHSQSHGGSSTGPVYPLGWDEKRIRAHWAAKA